jgi:hypothetical protein
VFPYRIEDGRCIDGMNNGGWKEYHRRPLTTHKVPASHCHKIVELHGRRTVTWVIRGEKEQDWGFFVHTFEKGVQKVLWWQYLGLPEPYPSAY